MRIFSCAGLTRSIAAVCVMAAGVQWAPSATASVGVTPGIGVRSAEGGCTLGFIATNSDKNLLGVTAGHCSTRVGEHIGNQAANLVRPRFGKPVRIGLGS